MTIDPVRARVFGQVAREYERVRSGYPAQLVIDTLDYAALDGRPALEIGAGTGKATAAFTAHGVRVTALEPDPAMLEVLHTKLPDVETVLSTFEDYSPPQTFGLLYCAQAWHWTDPAQRWPLAARALAPHGSLALFWISDDLADPDVNGVVEDLHRRIAPQVGIVAGTPTQGADPLTDAPWQELLTRPEFTDAQRHLYAWDRQLSTVDFLALLSTVSAYRLLDAPVRDALFAALRAELPEELTLAMHATLYLARRARQG
jgi:SAM-dependent methyltransferase